MGTTVSKSYTAPSLGHLEVAEPRGRGGRDKPARTLPATAGRPRAGAPQRAASGVRHEPAARRVVGRGDDQLRPALRVGRR